jgi:hypothetical protein
VFVYMFVCVFARAFACASMLPQPYQSSVPTHHVFGMCACKLVLLRSRAHTLHTHTHTQTHTLLRIYEPVSRFRGPNRALGTGGTRAPGPRMIRSRARAWECVSSFPGEAPSLFVSEGGGEAGSRGGSLARAALFDYVQRCSRHDTRTCLRPCLPSASRLARVHAR